MVDLSNPKNALKCLLGGGAARIPSMYESVEVAGRHGKRSHNQANHGAAKPKDAV